MRQLNLIISLWYLKHKTACTLSLVFFFVAVNLVIFSYVFVSGFEYFKSPWPEGGEILVKFPPRPYEALPVETKTVKALWNGKAYDLIAEIKNPNQNFGGTNFSYDFILNNQKKISGASYILPGESKSIIKTNVANTKEPVLIPQFVVSSAFTWTSKKVPITSSLSLRPESQKIYLNHLGQSELFAILDNKSEYSFKTVEVNVIILGQASLPLAINYTTLNNFYTNTAREILMQWPENFQDRAKEIKIEVHTNLYDATNLLPRPNSPAPAPSNSDQNKKDNYRDI